MKDREYEAVRDYCRPIVERWVRYMGLNDWDIKAHWHDQPFSLEKDGHGPDVVGFCDPQWEYQQAAISISCPKMLEYFFDCLCIDPAQVEYIIMHELGHCLMNEMREYRKDHHRATVGHEERTVTVIAKAFQRTYNQGYQDGRNALSKEEFGHHDC